MTKLEKQNYNKLCEKLDLPSIPDFLLASFDEVDNNYIDTSKGHTLQRGKFKSYYMHTKNLTSSKLRNWLKTTFDKHDIKIENPKGFIYQALIDGLKIHTDTGRNYVYNYIIDPGGSDVWTVFYNENKEEIYRVKIEPKTWYRLHTQTLHTVLGIEGVRFGVSVFDPRLDIRTGGLAQQLREELENETSERQ